tara:strand:- start:713 stop:1048 length:336 start_codon:yes stop_codon:yes gene_type:complete
MQLGLIFQSFGDKEIKQTFKERTRRDVINEFYEILVTQAKEEQEKAKMREYQLGVKQKIYPLPKYVVIMKKMDGMQTVADLEFFLGYCREAKHFSRCFYFNLKAVEKTFDK